MLSKKYRLAKEKDFKRVFGSRKTFVQSFVFIKLAENKLVFSRFGFVVGLKISKKAVERNKIRRQMQEIIRTNIAGIRKGFDVVVMVKTGIKGKSYQEIEIALAAALQKAGLLDKPWQKNV